MVTLALVLTALLFGIVTFAVGDMAGEKSASGEKIIRPPFMLAQLMPVCLSGANRHAIWYRQCKAGRGGDDHLCSAADYPSDHSGD